MNTDTRSFLRIIRSQESETNSRTTERRETLRLDIRPLRAALGVEMNGHRVTQTSLILNLSATGALVETARVWPIGTQLTCAFGLHGSGSFMVNATIVRSSGRRPPIEYGHMALHFLTRPGTDTRIMRWIFNELARQRGSR